MEVLERDFRFANAFTQVLRNAGPAFIPDDPADQRALTALEEGQVLTPEDPAVHGILTGVADSEATITQDIQLFDVNEPRYAALLNVEHWHNDTAGRHLLPGHMDVACSDCGALHWIGEKIKTSAVQSPRFKCCGNGDIYMPWAVPRQDEVPGITDLFKRSDRVQSHRVQNFFKHVRNYNSALGFTSMRVNVDSSILPTSANPGIYTYKIQGSVSHHISPPEPQSGYRPGFSQIYFMEGDYNTLRKFFPPSYFSFLPFSRGVSFVLKPRDLPSITGDPKSEAEHRMAQGPRSGQDQARRAWEGLDPATMMDLQNALHDKNPYVRQYKQHAENIRRRGDAEDLRLYICADVKFAQSEDAHRGTYNKPSAPEVAVIMPGDATAENSASKKRDISLKLRTGGLHRIAETHCAYDSLSYPLLFPHGDHGWQIGIPKGPIIPPGSTVKQKTVTALEFYNYRLRLRDRDFSLLHSAGRLFQQYVVDMYAKIEQMNLNYVSYNQKKLRADCYQGNLSTP